MDKELWHLQRAMTSHALGELAGSRWTLLHTQQCSSERQANVMAATLKVWRRIESQPRQSMRSYWKNNPAKFHPDPIWNDGALAFSEERRSDKKSKKKNNKMNSDMVIG